MAAKNAKARCAGTRRKTWQTKGYPGPRCISPKQAIAFFA